MITFGRAQLAVLFLCTVGAVRAQDDVTALVARGVEDLQATRGVTLAKPPPVASVTKEQYVEEYVLPSIDFEWGGDFEKMIVLVKALGMVPQDLDAKTFLRRHATSMTSAAYDFLTKRILFPGTPMERAALLHELMHASQDERHDLKALMGAAAGNLDETLARGALVEGEALNVQLRFEMGPPRALAGVTPYGTLREQARDYFETLNRRVADWLPDVPPAVLRAQAFVYEEGVLFVERLRRREHNWAAVDAAYKNPPRSTAQILHPEKYLAGEWPMTLDVRNAEKFFPPDYALVAENTLGEFGMRLFLMSHGSDAADAAKAFEGWRGDRVLLYRSSAKKADIIVWVSMWEDPARAAAAAKTLEQAFGRARTWARGPDVTLIVGGDFPAMPDFRVIRRPSAEGRPLVTTQILGAVDSCASRQGRGDRSPALQRGVREGGAGPVFSLVVSPRGGD